MRLAKWQTGRILFTGERLTMRLAAIATAVLFTVMHTGGTRAAEPPRAVQIARTTAIPACTAFVDAASAGGAGTAQAPHKTIAAAVAAAPTGAIICVAEGIYAEQLDAGRQSTSRSPAASSAARTSRCATLRAYVTKAQGKRRIVHPHRGSRPERQPAHGDRRLRDHRLLAGDRPRLSTTRSASTSPTTTSTTTSARSRRSPAAASR